MAKPEEYYTITVARTLASLRYGISSPVYLCIKKNCYYADAALLVMVKQQLSIKAQ